MTRVSFSKNAAICACTALTVSGRSRCFGQLSAAHAGHASAFRVTVDDTHFSYGESNSFPPRVARERVKSPEVTLGVDWRDVCSSADRGHQ